MADTIQGGTYLTIDGTQHPGIEMWSLAEPVEIHESRPSGTVASPETAVRKDGGLKNPTISLGTVDTDYATFKELYAKNGTKVPVVGRPRNEAEAADNPSLSGNAVIELGSIEFAQGGIVRMSPTLHVDGALALTP